MDTIYKKLTINLNKANISYFKTEYPTLDKQPNHLNLTASPKFNYKSFKTRMEEAERIAYKEPERKSQGNKKYIRLPSILKQKKGHCVTADVLNNMERAKIVVEDCMDESRMNYYGKYGDERNVYSDIKINREKTPQNNYKSMLNFEDEYK